MMINSEDLQNAGFSKFVFPSKYQKDEKERMAWSGYIDQAGFLTIRLILLSDVWEVDKIYIDYAEASNAVNLDWIVSANVDSIVKYIESIGTNRL